MKLKGIIVKFLYEQDSHFRNYVTPFNMKIDIVYTHCVYLIYTCCINPIGQCERKVYFIHKHYVYYIILITLAMFNVRHDVVTVILIWFKGYTKYLFRNVSIITAETYTVYEGQRLNAVSNSAFYDSVYLINHVFKDDALFSRVVKYGLMVDLCVANIISACTDAKMVKPSNYNVRCILSVS